MYDDLDADIARRIRIARTVRTSPLQQKELLARLGILGFSISESGMSKIETGKRKLSFRELIIMAQALQVSILWLLGLEKDTGGIPQMK